MSKNDAGQTTIYYQIDVYLDTSAGNEYQASTLAADFVWSADDESLAAPDTGDNINIILWIIILICSAAIILLLLLNHRKEEKNRE